MEEKKKKAGRPKKVVTPDAEKIVKKEKAVKKEKPVVEEEISEPVITESVDNQLTGRNLTQDEINAMLEENISSPDPVETIVSSLVGDQTGLSQQAANWEKYLAYQKITPEEWLRRSPKNKFKHFVQEIIDFRAKNDSSSI